MQRDDASSHTTLAAPPSGSKQQSQQQQPKALRFVTNYGAPHPKRSVNNVPQYLPSLLTVHQTTNWRCVPDMSKAKDRLLG